MGAILGEIALLNEAPRNAAVKSGKDGCVCTFISHDLFAEIQCVTGGALGRNMSAINQLISFDDWVSIFCCVVSVCFDVFGVLIDKLCNFEGTIDLETRIPPTRNQRSLGNVVGGRILKQTV